jgi:aspartyl protease family protein
MSDPWRGAPPPETPEEQPSRGQPWLWPLLILAIIGLVFALARAFPGAVSTTDDWSRVAYSAGLLILLTAGAARIQRGMIRKHLRDIAIWVAIVAVLALGYAYRDVFEETGQRLQLAFGGGTPVQTGERELVIPRDESGHFLVVGKVNGQAVRFMVDTGATDTVLSPADARRLGLDVDALDYGYKAETANGIGYAAATTVDRLEVGPIRADNFRLMVNKAPMSASLLGMSFLGDLDSYQVRGDRLTMTWKNRG